MGEIEGEEAEISWIQQSDLGPLFRAFPLLEKMEIRGGENLRLMGASHPNLNTGGIVEHFRSQEAGRHLAKLAAQEAPVLPEGLETEFSDCLQKLAQMVDEQRYEELVQQARVRSLTKQEESEFRRLVARSKQPGHGEAERDPRRKEG